MNSARLSDILYPVAIGVMVFSITLQFISILSHFV